MIASLIDMARALELADEALNECEDYLPRIGDEYDPALTEVARLGSDVLQRATRIHQRIRSVLLSRGGL